MGGGTGTGAAPVVAQIARELGILTVAVVTKPFAMEGSKRMQIAEQGIQDLGKYVDSLITIPNEKLLSVLGPQTTLLDAFKAANEVLQGAVQGIAELITRPGLINVDFADVRTVMAEMGMAMMGSGSAAGEDRAREAAEAAISSPLLEDINGRRRHGDRPRHEQLDPRDRCRHRPRPAAGAAQAAAGGGGREAGTGCRGGATGLS